MFIDFIRTLFLPHYCTIIKGALILSLHLKDVFLLLNFLAELSIAFTTRPAVLQNEIWTK